MITSRRARILGLIILGLLGLATTSQATDPNPGIWGPGPGLLKQHFNGYIPHIPDDKNFGFVPTTWRAFPPTPTNAANNSLQIPTMGEYKLPPPMPRADEDKEKDKDKDKDKDTGKDKLPLLPNPNVEKQPPMTSTGTPGHYRSVYIEVH